MTDPEEPSASESGRRTSATAAVHSGVLACEVCGRDTPHRILHVESGSPGGALTGIARCQVCRTVHRFQILRARTREVRVIASDGPASRTLVASVPLDRTWVPGDRLQVGSEELVVRKIESTKGRPMPSARTAKVAAFWATVDRGAVVPVSLIEGRHTSARRLLLRPETPITVGSPLEVDHERVRVSALRADGRTWARPGDSFPAARVQRVYARRNDSPPAGNRGWSSPRPSSSSTASARSVSSRVRSSPGTRTARRVPRERSAEGGATLQSSTSS